MNQFVHRIDVYCDTLTRGINFYVGRPIDLRVEPEELQAFIAILKTPGFLKKIDVNVQPLDNKQSETILELYVTFQIRRERQTHKLRLHAEEDRQLNIFIDQLIKQLMRKVPYRV